MAEANDQLRTARERTASPTHPDVGLTRQELADLVNTWVWEHHDKKVVLATANYIGKLETGIIRWPSISYREAFRAILGAPNDDALGFVNARSRRAAVKLDKVDRQNLVRGTVALSLGALIQGPLAALLNGIEPPPVPTRVSATDIEQIRTATRGLESWHWTYGGGSVRAAAMGQLRWSAGLLDAICPKRLRPELHSALGDLADVAGWMAVDANAKEEASQVFGFALGCAEKADDWPLRAQVLSSMAQQAVRTGKPDEGLTLAEHALVRPDRLPATSQAVLHTVRGRALVKMRRINETLTAVGTADDHFAHSTPANDPPRMAFYTDARHAQFAGRPLADLAILGHNTAREATDRLTTAAAGHAANNNTSRAVCLAMLASLTMATGDPLQAATIGHEALDVAGTLRSRQVTDELRELSHHATAHQNLDEIAHLRHRIATLLVHTDSP